MRFRFLTVEAVISAAIISGLTQEQARSLCRMLVVREIDEQTSQLGMRLNRVAEKAIESFTAKIDGPGTTRRVPVSRINAREGDID